MADDVAEEFKNEILGVLHPGHEAVMELDPEYFAALKNYYSTWTISRKEAAISRATKRRKPRAAPRATERSPRTRAR